MYPFLGIDFKNKLKESYLQGTLLYNLYSQINNPVRLFFLGAFSLL